MATISQLASRLVDLFGSPVTANPAKLLGNLGVSPNGNVLVGTSTDNATDKLQVTGSSIVSTHLAVGKTAYNTAQSGNGVQVANGVSVEGYDTNGAQLRLMSSASAGNNSIFRDDGTNLYLLRSSTNYGTYSSQRPLTYNHSTGNISLQSDNSAKVIIGNSSDIGSSTIFQIYSSTGLVPLSMRNTGTTAGNYWIVGPDGSNNFIMYNQGSTGVWLGNGGTAWNASSDERLKNIQEPLSDAIARVNAIRTIKYTWKKDDDHAEALGEIPDSRVYVGVIAQDVQKVLPEAVTEGSTGYLGVAYSELTPLALAAIKELSAKIDELSMELKELKAKING